MRGFTMILVVAYHLTKNYGATVKMASIDFVVLFRMPLFFFVSGYLAYKASQVWTARNYGALLLKKFRIQVIPTVIFFLLFTAVIRNDFGYWIVKQFHSEYKSGYWFTIALLYMFVIYYTFAFVEARFKRHSWLPVTLLMAVAVAVEMTFYHPELFSWAYGFKGTRPQWLYDSSFVTVMRYFPYFMLGNIVHRYWQGFQQLTSRKWFFPTLVTIAIFASIDVLKWHFLRGYFAGVSRTVAEFSLLMVVLMFFMHYKDSFTAQKPLGRGLQYIGTRTLDIYLLHYFFLPRLGFMGTFFSTYPKAVVLEITVSITLALIVIAFCLLTSNILRISPLLKKYLFGRS